MNRKRIETEMNANAAVTTNVYDHRSKAKYEPPQDGKTPWYLAASHWLGITMASTENPKQRTFSPATVTLSLVILGMVAAGAYYMGQRDSDARQLIERLEKIEKTAQQAKDLSLTAATGTGRGHESNTNTKAK